MMTKAAITRLKLFSAALLTALLTQVCSSGYITPASLTATAAAPTLETQIPTAFFVAPTETETPPPTPTDTPDPLHSPTPTIPQDTPTPEPTATATPDGLAADAPPLVYHAQSGDTLAALAARFGVNPFEIVSTETFTDWGFLSPGQMLMIPQRLGQTTAPDLILPDSEFLFSSTATDFHTSAYVNIFTSHLVDYREYLGSSGWNTGADVVQRVAINNSVSPRLLLGLLQYQANWVFGYPMSLSQTDYPMGYVQFDEQGLYRQLTWAANVLSEGYYGWRRGSLTHITYQDGTQIRLNPNLNAGTAALIYYFNELYPNGGWEEALNPEAGFPLLYGQMFGDPWARAVLVEPLLPANLAQPPLILPFMRETIWAYTGGPHGAWEHDGAQAALDFAPGSLQSGCVPSDLWVLAAAPGIIVRIETGVVVQDLDGDGDEHTGWSLLYLHVTDLNNLHVGEWLDLGDLIGHPSCEGGISTGTHLHIARKFNGEWIEADGPIPFNLGGWVAHAGEEPYLGTLMRGDEVIEASIYGAFYTRITRSHEDP